jgi:predicted transcriptional regulator
MKMETIEVDEATAAELKRWAAERGVTVSEVVAELVPLASDAADADDIAELDRRWEEAQAKGAIPHEEVERWLRTWGTPDYKPWSRR